MDLDGRLGGVIADQVHNVLCLGVSLRGAQPATGSDKTSGNRAADAKAAS
jgi:hypothetical protein